MNSNELKDSAIIKETNVKAQSLFKRFIRKMTYWLYRPMFDQQSEYNKQLLSIIDDISRKSDELTAAADDLKQKTAEIAATQNCIAENIRNLNSDRQQFVNLLGTQEVEEASRKIADYINLENTIAENIRNLNSDMEVLKSVKCYLPKNDKPRVIQLVSCLNFGDAVGNEVVAFKKFLRENGYVTEIFTECMSSKLPSDTAVNFRKMPVFDEDDIVIYHFASQCSLFDSVKQLKCKVILRYHNVTPPEFFSGYDENAVIACSNGLSQARELKPYIDYCLPVSEFNKTDLMNMGYTCPMTVLPILIRFSDYDQTPDNEVIQRYSDGIKNILFVGRMAPNKKVEDVISAFSAYKDKYDPSARLFLVGSYNENDGYFRKLRDHIEKLGVKDVIFPGHISFAAILAYYSIADVFLCMSEHEGFCVPLVEAMRFKTPIVAYKSTAIPSTLNGSGILLNSKDFDKAADAVHEAVGKSKDKLIEGQDNRLKDFASSVITKQLLEFLNSVEKQSK